MNLRGLFLALLLVPAVSFAQTGTPPAAGLTPQSPFYFLDRLGELVQEFMAFSPEAKVRVQVGFAAERIAEIIIDMESKDVDAKGLAVAQERLQEHLTKASEVVKKEKNKGKDVTEWEDMIKGEFEVSKKVLESSFEVAKDALEDKREELKDALKEAKASGDATQVEALQAKLADLEDQKDQLEADREEQKRALEDEREKLDDDENSDDTEIEGSKDVELNGIEKDLKEIEIEIED